MILWTVLKDFIGSLCYMMVDKFLFLNLAKFRNLLWAQKYVRCWRYKDE